MSQSFEEAIIRHCAATLAGHKCGSLFFHASCTAEDIDSANAAMNGKGVRVIPLRTCARGTLVYVLRPGMLNERLARADVQAFLRERGYERTDLESCIAMLKSRVCPESFPHEIGVFLDYPLADVIAFIRNKGENCPLTGCWKAYTNECEAMRVFQRYKACRAAYQTLFRAGWPLERLTVRA